MKVRSLASFRAIFSTQRPLLENGSDLIGIQIGTQADDALDLALVEVALHALDQAVERGLGGVGDMKLNTAESRSCSMASSTRGTSDSPRATRSR